MKQSHTLVIWSLIQYNKENTVQGFCIVLTLFVYAADVSAVVHPCKHGSKQCGFGYAETFSTFSTWHIEH